MESIIAFLHDIEKSLKIQKGIASIECLGYGSLLSLLQQSCS